jgi:hypothetical protein
MVGRSVFGHRRVSERCTDVPYNGVRIPAINAVVLAVQGSTDPSAYQAALDVLVSPLESDAMIGGMEVRMVAIGAVERIGRGTSNVAVKAKAMGLLQAYAARTGWEPEAKVRALDARQRSRRR